MCTRFVECSYDVIHILPITIGVPRIEDRENDSMFSWSSTQNGCWFNFSVNWFIEAKKVSHFILILRWFCVSLAGCHELENLQQFRHINLRYPGLKARGSNIEFLESLAISVVVLIIPLVRERFKRYSKNFHLLLFFLIFWLTSKHVSNDEIIVFIDLDSRRII
jgi:hypothetical protein